jgi:hypothetical protein
MVTTHAASINTPKTMSQTRLLLSIFRTHLSQSQLYGSV